MVATIPTNPFTQLGGNAGLFNVTSDGLRQGTAYPDPATRYALRQGILSQNETIPMWGGVGVYANVPGGAGNPSYALGYVGGRATALTGSTKLVGFSVFDQAYNMVTSPSSPVPLIGSGGSFNWYGLGSRARIAVACDPALVSLRQSTISPQVSWDFTNQLLVPYLGTLTISSGTYNTTTGVIVLTMAVAPTWSAGDSVTLASLTGTGAYASLNGTWTTTGVSGSTATLAGPIGVGASSITGGNLTVGGSASQALLVDVLDVQSTNCETVVYSATTNTATWNYNGACAVIQLTQPVQ